LFYDYSFVELCEFASTLQENVFAHYKYPILYTTLVETGVTLALTVINLSKAAVDIFVLKKRSSSIMCDRFFFRKLMLMLLTGVAFGIGNVLSNAGLASGTVVMHVLFRSSEIGWVVVFSAVFLFDLPTIPILYACALLLVGCVMTGLDYSNIIVHDKDFYEAFIGNFVSAFLLGFQYVTLRSMWLILKESPTNQLEAGYELDVISRDSKESTTIIEHEPAAVSTVDNDKVQMSVLEALQFKMLIGAMALPIAGIYQSDGWSAFNGTTMLYLMGSCFFTLGLHGSIVGLSSVATATTTGFVAQIPIALQFIINVVFFGGEPDWRQWLGAGLIFVGAMFYSGYKAIKTETDVSNGPLVKFMKWLESLAFCWRR